MSHSLELDEQLAAPLRDYCARHALRETELVNRLLREFLAQEQAEPASPFQLWQQVFTPEGSGLPDLGSRAKSHLKEKLRGRHPD